MNIRESLERREGPAEIKGWIYRERGSASMRFLVIRDTDDIIQCVVRKDDVDQATWDAAESVRVEASVIARGTLKPDPRAPTGVELQVEELQVIGESNEFPITKDQSPEHLANNRHLWLRSRKMNAILKVRHVVFQAFREYFNEHEFREYHSPMFQSTQCEGGSDLFAVKYFDDELFLAQTWQLQAEAGIASIERLYTIAPSFRAENSKTSRHLTEYWHAEMEMAWCDFEDIKDHGEGVLKHILARVLTQCRPELELLERDLRVLEASRDKTYPRMTYDEALAILKDKFSMEIEWGKDLRTVEEDKLSSLYDTPVIVSEYPTRVKAFYMKEVPGRPEVVQGCDFLAPEGYGEIIGGSQREEDIDAIKERLLRDGEDPSEYEEYLDTRRYGSVPHGGFGMGMERVISWICGLDTIKDAIAFPRTPTRYRP